MRKSIFFIVPVAVILISVCAYSEFAAGANLLTNADFEKGDLSGWGFWSDGGTSADVTREGKSDSFCAKVSFRGQKGNLGVIYQKVEVTPGQTVIFKSDLMSKDISKAVGYIKIVFHKGFDFSPIGDFFASDKLTSPSLGKTFSVEAKIPEGALFAELGLVLHGLGSGEGSVYFDNCEVEIKK